MDFVRTKISDIVIITPKVYGDGRGFFLETFREDLFAEFGITPKFIQDNHSGSQQGILRGLHYQIRQAQGKLIRTVAGDIFDVAVDLRRRSSTFGSWMGVLLTAENKKQIWIPPGFAHGFYVMSAWAEVVYKSTDYYAPEWERSLLWNDPALGIEWPLLNGQPPFLSEKDKHGKLLSEAEVFD
ncbi:MAG: dTDP-4-dehydrorhamnose 3,5-epimerase [Anaerolineales bacterium]|jgi:dTDP-4-dehydrorhamnose 3,5-epimerase